MNQVLIEQIIMTILIVVVAYFSYHFLNRGLRKIRGHGIEANKKKTLFGLLNSIIKYVIAIIAVIAILEVFKIDTRTILASVGILGLVFGLALQDIIKAFLSGFFIILDDQYNVGDIVTINGFKGEVILLGLKSTKIKADNGDVKTISNNAIIETINHTDSKSIASVNIQVSYNNDLEQVEHVLKNLVEQLNADMKNIKENIVLYSFDNNNDVGVEFRLTVTTMPNKNADVERIIRREINKVFVTNKIKMS